MDTTRGLEATQQALAEHIDAALANATDETAVFHLRQAKQLTVDLPTVVTDDADGCAD